MTDLFDLTGSTALVTGASRGIGRSIALGLASAGADVVATATDAATLDGLGTEITGLGRTFRGHSLDLSQRANVDAFIEAVLADTGAPDILVNNAGMIARAPALQHSDEQWDTTLAVDLTSHFRITRALGAGMVERGHGRVIFTASLLSFQGGINVVSYTAAKSGILGLTHALANEWAPHGVTVNAIVPGYIATDNTLPLTTDEARRRSIEERIPMGRWGTPDDLVGAAVFLASRASGYVTGTHIAVDGGWLSR
ncbi:SDR family oxidoreductase [Compostimonas suwonensis]|uniref:2-deoxy-D-gluconate 3-dehydrogenase n=1 Tax=Compostimonas suwonensis TaxID=1048394 RepID=A0A2M9BBQ7_9MICO|nr:SDR family oxidoreductase [Compostimonas suwonensis]PJJ55362.1 2-deoxy-D-gluconate 3-dehydrogenase [Compostimonas suwonensis]